MTSAIAVQFGTALMGFFAIMNPIANTTIFVGLTSDDDSATRRAVALRALALAFGIVAVFCMAGEGIFHAFGITLPALRITGGLLIFLIGVHMLQGTGSPAQKPRGAVEDAAADGALSIAVSPLAMPILAGPGTIAAAMGYVAGRPVPMIAATIAAFGVLCIITFVFFMSGDRLVRFLGREAISVITRMMGLIIAVIGTQMTIEGIRGAQLLG